MVGQCASRSRQFTAISAVLAMKEEAAIESSHHKRLEFGHAPSTHAIKHPTRYYLLADRMSARDRGRFSWSRGTLPGTTGAIDRLDITRSGRRACDVSRPCGPFSPDGRTGRELCLAMELVAGQAVRQRDYAPRDGGDSRRVAINPVSLLRRRASRPSAY